MADGSPRETDVDDLRDALHRTQERLALALAQVAALEERLADVDRLPLGGRTVARGERGAAELEAALRTAEVEIESLKREAAAQKRKKQRAQAEVEVLRQQLDVRAARDA